MVNMNRLAYYFIKLDMVKSVQLLICFTVVMSAVLITSQFAERIWTGQSFLSFLICIIIGTEFCIYVFWYLSSNPIPFKHVFGLLVGLGILQMIMVGVSALSIIIFNLSLVFFTYIASRILPYFSPTKKRSFHQWFHKLNQYRSLIRLWVRYKILSRYSQTILGVLWIIIQPLAISLILAVAFSQLFDRAMRNDVPFIAFFLSGLTFWNFFNSYLMTGSSLLINSMGLQIRVYFPREIILIVNMGQSLIEFLFTFVSMIIVNALFGIAPNVYWVYLPILMLIQCIFMMGIVFFLSVISVYIRDIPKLTGVVLRIFFYLTPLLYPITIWPDSLEKYFQLNPIAMLIQAYRDVLLYQQAPDFVSLHFAIIIGFWLMITGYIYFKINEGRISDYR